MNKIGRYEFQCKLNDAIVYTFFKSKSNQTLFSNLYQYKHVIHDEIYILEKRMEKKLNNLYYYIILYLYFMYGFHT